jgi:hypothetical protein
MATFRKRGDYQWEAQIRRKGHSAISKTFTTRVDAELWAATNESEMGRGGCRPTRSRINYPAGGSG